MLFMDGVPGEGRGPVVPKGVRKRRFTCINVTVRPDRPANRKQESNTHAEGV